MNEQYVTLVGKVCSPRYEEVYTPEVKSKLPIEASSEGRNLKDYIIYGNNNPNHVDESQSTLPVSIDTYGGNAEDWEIFGNNNPVVETKNGNLPLELTSSAGNVIDYTIYGNNNCNKNLLEITAESQTINGVTFTVDKQAGTVTATRESASSSDAILAIEIPDEVKGQNVYFSGCPSEGSANTYNIYAFDYTTTSRAPQWDGTTLSVTDYGTSNNNEVRFIEEHRSQIRLRVKAGYNAQNLVFKPMIRKADTISNFEPYTVGVGENTEVKSILPIEFRSNGDDLLKYKIYGTAEGAGETKNLLEITAESRTINGVTFTVDKQAGTITANGTANSGSGAYLNLPINAPSGDYYYSGCALGGSASTYDLFAWDNTISGRPKKWDGETNVDSDYGGTSQEIKVDSEHSMQLTIRIRSGCTCNNLVFKPMLRRAETTPDFEPFGYKIPLVTVSGTQTKDTVIPIGNTKLMAGDYIDYESGKIFKAKRIHEDTVTIDGIEWDILDYDHDEVYKADGTRAKHTVTIQTHDIVNELQYSAKQAAFAFPYGLVAGTYHFTVGAHPWVAGDVNKVLTFTLANAIPTGGQLVFNGTYNRTLVGTTVSVFVSPTSTTAAETVTMTEGDTGTDLGTILRSKTDAINSIDRALLGSNNWNESAMRQYLNSDKAAGSVWTPQTVFDRPPTWATTTAGFLHGIDPDFVAVLGNVKKTTGLNNISDGGGTAVHDEKFFLLSRSEVYMGDEYTGGEGTPYAYYKNYSDSQVPSISEDKNRIKYRAGVARQWWLRSPTASTARTVRFVEASGAWGNSGAVNTNGVAPACCIVLDDMDDWVKQTFYTEVDADLPAIETFKGTNTLDSTVEVGETMITQGYRIPLDIQHKTKNLVDITGFNNVYFGVQWYDDNGQLKASGTYNDSAAHTWPRFYVELSAGTYTLSGSPDYAQTGVRLQIGTCTDAQGSNFTSLGFDTGSGYTFTLQTGSWVSIRVYTAASLYQQTIDLTLPIMLRLADTSSDFEPYYLTNHEDIYIGNSPLTQGQTITKSQSNVDLELFSGDNIIDTTLVNKPDASITYNSSVLGVGERTITSFTDWESGTTITGVEQVGKPYAECKRNASLTTRRRSVSIIPVVSGVATLNITSGYQVADIHFDKDGLYIGNPAAYHNNNYQISISDNVKYVAIVVKKSDNSEFTDADVWDAYFTYSGANAYKIPLLVTSGQQSTPHTIYIGDSPLTAGQSVTKASSGTDITLYQGENTISTTLGNKPEMKIDYLSTEVGVGERTKNLLDINKHTYSSGISDVVIDEATGALSFTGTGTHRSVNFFATDLGVEMYGKTYTVSCVNNLASTTEGRLAIRKATTHQIVERVSFSTTGNKSITFTPDEETFPNGWYISVLATGSTSTTGNVDISQLMLCETDITPDFEPFGYQIPIDIKQDDEVVDHKDIYIGTQPLEEGASVSKVSVGEDITLVSGKNYIDTDLFNKPEMYIK